MGQKNKSYRIAIVLAGMDIEYARETLRGIMRQAKEDGFEIFIFNTYVGSDEMLKHNIGEYNLYSLINYAEFDGVILYANMIQGHAVFDSVIDAIKRSHIPTVCIDADIDGICEVGIENYTGMKQIVEHLIEHHHFTKIIYISGQDFNTDSQERLAAYCDAMKEHNLIVEEKNIYRGHFIHETGRIVARKLVESGDELPEAIVCATDSIAMGVRSVFEELGIDIPGQVAVTGFDNMFEARYAIPRLTTVDRNLQREGREAMIKLRNYLKDGKHMISEKFPTIPLFAGSCGCELIKEKDIQAVSYRYISVTEHYGEYLYESNLMIENLNDSTTFDALLEALKHHVAKLQCDRFYLCLDKRLTENLKFAGHKKYNGTFSDEYANKGYPETMSVALGYEYGEYVSCGDFPSKQMWPDIELGKDEDNVWIFSPIHFKDRCMGYVFIKNSHFAMESPLFCTWLINLSNGLENLRKQAKLQHVLEQLENMYVTDMSTGLYNRQGFIQCAGERFRSCIKEQKPFMILFADMDGLKRINDEFGHEKGDVAIRTVADALKNASRAGDICARFGGDEYVMYGENYSEADALEFGRRFEAELDKLNAVIEMPFRVGASYGYEIVVPKEGEGLDKYIDKADNRMYEQKKGKKVERRG